MSTIQSSQLPPHSGWPTVATRLQGTAYYLRRLESQKLGSPKKKNSEYPYRNTRQLIRYSD